MSRFAAPVKPTGSRWPWWLVGGLIVAAWLPSLHGDFLLDDYGLSWLTKPDGRVDWGATFGYFFPSHLERDQFLRPLPLLASAIDLSIWGPNAWGFHLTNVLIHLLGALVVGGLAGAVARGAGSPSPRGFAMLAALAYGLYPGHAEAVGWIIHRMVGMTVLFAGLALLVHTRRAWRPLAWLITLAALLCKEPALVVPLAIILFDRLRAPARGWRPAIAAAIPYAAVVGIWFGWKWLCFGQLSTGYGAYSTYGGYFLGEKVYLEIPGSVLRFVSPVNAAVVPDVWRIAHVAVTFALLLAALVGVVRARGAVLAVALFGVGWAVLSLGLVAPFLRVSPELTNSRHFSAPAMGLAIALAAGVIGLVGGRSRVGVIVAAALLALWFIPQPANLTPYVEAGRLAHAVRTGVARHGPGPLFVAGVPSMHRGAPVFGDGSMLDAAVAPPFGMAFGPRKIDVLTWSVAAVTADPDSVLHSMAIPPRVVEVVDGTVRPVVGSVTEWGNACPTSITLVSPIGGGAVRLRDDPPFVFRPDRAYPYYRFVFRFGPVTFAFTADAATDTTAREDGTVAYHLSRGDVTGRESFFDDPKLASVSGAVGWSVEGVDDHTRVKSARARSDAATLTASQIGGR